MIDLWPVRLAFAATVVALMAPRYLTSGTRGVVGDAYATVSRQRNDDRLSGRALVLDRIRLHRCRGGGVSSSRSSPPAWLVGMLACLPYTFALVAMVKGIGGLPSRNTSFVSTWRCDVVRVRHHRRESLREVEEMFAEFRRVGVATAEEFALARPRVRPIGPLRHMMPREVSAMLRRLPDHAGPFAVATELSLAEYRGFQPRADA